MCIIMSMCTICKMVIVLTVTLFLCIFSLDTDIGASDGLEGVNEGQEGDPCAT